MSILKLIKTLSFLSSDNYDRCSKNAFLLKFFVSVTEILPVDENLKFLKIRYAFLVVKIIFSSIIIMIFSTSQSKLSVHEKNFDRPLIEILVLFYSITLVCGVAYHYIMRSYYINIVLNKTLKLCEFYRTETYFETRLYFKELTLFVLFLLIMVVSFSSSLQITNLYIAVGFICTLYTLIKYYLLVLLYEILIDNYLILVHHINDILGRNRSNKFKNVFSLIIRLEHFITSVNDLFSVQMFFLNIAVFFSILTNFFLYYAMVFIEANFNGQNGSRFWSVLMLNIKINLSNVMWTFQCFYVIWKIFWIALKAEIQVKLDCF